MLVLSRQNQGVFLMWFTLRLHSHRCEIRFTGLVCPFSESDVDLHATYAIGILNLFADLEGFSSRGIAVGVGEKCCSSQIFDINFSLSFIYSSKINYIFMFISKNADFPTLFSWYYKRPTNTMLAFIKNKFLFVFQ